MILSNNELLAIIVEDAYGTDPLSGANASSYLAPVRGSVTVKEVVAEVQDPSVFAVQSTRESQSYGDYTEISFQVPLTGKGGTAGTAPEYGALFQACGMVETISASTSVTYTPNAGGINDAGGDTSFTLVYLELDDTDSTACLEHRITGIRGNWQIILNQGEPAMLQFDGQGLYAAPPTATSTVPTLPTDYQAAANRNFLVVQGLTNTVGGTTACFTSATFDFGMTTAQERCATGASAVSEIYVAREGNPVTATYELRADESTLLTWVGAIEDATTYALVCTLTDGTDTVSLTAPVFQPNEYSVSRGEGRKTVSLTSSLHGNFGSSNGADQITITYT